MAPATGAAGVVVACLAAFDDVAVNVRPELLLMVVQLLPEYRWCGCWLAVSSATQDRAEHK